MLLACVYLVTGVLQQTAYYHHWKRERPFDPATGVYSRVSFIEQAQSILERAKFRGDAVGVLLLDIDHFKSINDSHGHNVGDKALVALTEAIKQEIRDDKDIPARWGGEEFVVLIPEVTREVLDEVAERIRVRVSITPVGYTHKDPGTGEVRAHQVAMTVSIGAALFPDADEGATDSGLLELIERADKLMYAAKADGRNRVRSTWPQNLDNQTRAAGRPAAGDVVSIGAGAADHDHRPPFASRRHETSTARPAHPGQGDDQSHDK